LVRAVQRDVQRQSLGRLGHAHPVVPVDRVERRDVEDLLGLGPPGVVGMEQVAVPPAVGVAHFGDDAHERAGDVVAPEQRERVEDVAEAAGVGQHRDRSAVQIDPVRGQVGIDVGPDALARIPEVIPRVEAGERAQAERQPGQIVQVDEPLVTAVPNVVAHRLGAHMGDLDLVQVAAHQCAPKLAAASTPDRQPSS
jgi:hypothetical protein